MLYGTIENDYEDYQKSYEHRQCRRLITYLYLNFRFYGPLMLSHLFANWNLKFASWPYKGNGGGRQVTFVLEKELNI